MGTETETAAALDFVGSAWLVATTWYVPAVAGAVYVPSAATDPPVASCTDHATAVSLVPKTVALKFCVAPTWTRALAGVTATTTPTVTTVPGAQAAASTSSSGSPIRRKCIRTSLLESLG